MLISRIKSGLGVVVLLVSMVVAMPSASADSNNSGVVNHSPCSSIIYSHGPSGSKARATSQELTVCNSGGGNVWAKVYYWPDCCSGTYTRWAVGGPTAITATSTYNGEAKYSRHKNGCGSSSDTNGSGCSSTGYWVW